MNMLRNRKTVPYVQKDPEGIERIVLLPGEDKDSTTSAGRPISDEYWSCEEKLKQMERFKIKTSIVSVANPWLDFLEKEEQIEWATLLNDDLNKMCEQHQGKLYGFGMLPLKDINACIKELRRISTSLPFIKGIILSTFACGAGLDDPQLLPLFGEVETLGLTIFLHPHYGVGNEHFGCYGHKLYLALGFPFETGTAVAKLVLSGVLEKLPNLRLLLAHSGGVLPFLAGRLDACARNDEQFNQKSILTKPPSEYLKKLYFDAITYHSPGLNCSIEFAGIYNLMFGTDHPFSISDPECLYDSMSHLSQEMQDSIKFGNAQRIFNIK